MYILFYAGIFLLGLAAFLLVFAFNKLNYIKQTYDSIKNLEKQKHDFEVLIDSLVNKQSTLVQQTQQATELYNEVCENIQKSYDELGSLTAQLEDKKNYVNLQTLEWDRSLAEKKKHDLGELSEWMDLNEEKKKSIQSDINNIQTAYYALMQAVQTVERQKQDYAEHMIQLSDNDKTDIKFLISILDQLKNKELVAKLIWSEYLQRPFNQMLKYVLGAQVHKNVIYGIENMDTHQIYIGKTSGDVKNRWTDHIKASLGIGTISHQEIHNALFNHWDKFAWKIIEEVAEGSLAEREKYYIKLFASDKYGYNMKVG